ncbi:condensation domain-containing protein [Micromonospora matsumotoense]|uniref:condensation domain-containing protein n=1 Tax=Micromonospora matsumotoense TaxID=121616 RepID=UPI0033D9C8C9
MSTGPGTPPGTLAVAFRATDAGEAPLTWGQAHMWRAVDEFPHLDAALNIRRSFLTEPTVGVAPAVAAIRRLAERHQAVRTRVRWAGTAPSQSVEASGTITVDVETVPAGELTRALDVAVDRLAGSAFCLDREWPVRLVLVCVGDQVGGVGLVGSHIVLDGWAMQLLTDELRALLGGGEPDEVRWQPLDQAREERSERGQRLERKTLRFWRRSLEVAPPSAFAEPPGPDHSLPVRRWQLESPAVAAVVPLLAQRLGVSTSTVLLTASALIIRALTRTEPVVLKVIAGNRTTARQRSLVAGAAQDGIFVLRPPAGDVAETARRVYRDATEAYYYASADPFTLVETMAQVARDRGSAPDLSLFFNDARLGREWPDTLLAEVSRPAVRELRARGRIVAVDRLAGSDMKLLVAVTHAPAYAGVSLLADLRHVPEQTGVRALRAVEALLCEALLRPLPTADIPDLIAAQSAEVPQSVAAPPS